MELIKINAYIDGAPGTVMTVELINPLDTTQKIMEWNDRMTWIGDELDDRDHVKRISYDKWRWHSDHELNRWLTYYHLRHTNDKS